MLSKVRRIWLDICDYENRVVCSLFDNSSNIDGQATDVFVTTERNGWKEISFSIPSTLNNGEDNYRLDYLIADYKIRLKTDTDTDWFIISEARISHNNKSKNVDIQAGHISQLLKTKNLGLEFSIEEGNNTGTAEELLETILDGTDWNVGYVYPFKEDDGATTKVRSFTASEKTGAFKLITDMCEKFEAKPIFNGDKTVDIYPMNPFAKVKEGEIPEQVLNGANVLELYYDRNVKSLSRTLNSENIVTRLYAYGSSGDATTGICSLKTEKHKEYTFTLPSHTATQEFLVELDGDRRFFVAPNAQSVVWSSLDFLSRSYVWDGTTAYHLYKEPKTTTYKTLTGSVASVQNYFDYVMDFGYYYDIGLLSDTMFQKLAAFQRTMPPYIENSITASTALGEQKLELSKIAESNTGFLKLNVLRYDQGTRGEVKLVLKKTTAHPDGILYRSDYMEARKNYFSWFCAEDLKENGDPVSGIGSVVYIIHNTNPTTWEKAYVKEIDDKVATQDYSYRNAIDPSSITLWLSLATTPALSSSDKIYLFSTNSISGRLGVLESEDEALVQSIRQATKVQTELHPTYFVWDDDPDYPAANVKDGYGWQYRSSSTNTSLGSLSFCYGAAGERQWHKVYAQETDPTVERNAYYFNLKTKILYHGEDKWVNVKDSGIIINESSTSITEANYYAPDTEAQRLSQSFSKVIYYCYRHDRLYKGLYNKYTYTPTSNLAIGNYAIKCEFGFYWVFSTDRVISANQPIWLDSTNGRVYQTDQVENIVRAEEKPYEVIEFPVANELDGKRFVSGSINSTTGQEANSKTLYRSYNITLHHNATYAYKLPSGSKVAFYDSNKRYLKDEYLNLSASGTFTTSNRVKYARFICSSQPTSSHYVQINERTKKLYVNETQYTILSSITKTGEREGIVTLIKKFATTADTCYGTYLNNYLSAQSVIKQKEDDLKQTLGDLYREGFWQNQDYVSGDESKLYKDALDNLEQISKPEATYDIDFLDLYGTNINQGYSVEDLYNVEWPDVDTTYAAHLIDPEINVNLWGYLDQVKKCYDKPWQTSISVNTNLSLIGQHSFTDVMAQIATVASKTKANQEIYERAGSLTGAGKLAADLLEGKINANVNSILGGASNWYTDEKGRMIFESADGVSAMMLSGYGFALASSKNANGDWDWRVSATGMNGITADEIATGFLSATRLLAGSITTDHLNASVGQELDIGSNIALTLYATEDGFRPSGSVLTPTVNEGDSYIQIGAKNGSDPAYINIMTGGVMNVYSGSKMNIQSGSTMNIESQGRLEIKSGSAFVVSSPNFSISDDGNVRVEGNITATSGKISGFTIGSSGSGSSKIDYLYSGSLKTISATGSGVYLGTDGINIGGKFVYKFDGSTAKVTIPANNLIIGSTSFTDIKNTLDSNTQAAHDAADAAQETADSKSATYRCSSTDIVKKSYKVGDVWTCTDTVKDANGNNVCYYYQYVCKQVSNPRSLNDWTLTGTAVTAGAAIAIDADSGKIDMIASGTINILSGETITVAANKKLSLTTKGTVEIGNGVKPFTIGATTGTSGHAYIYNGVTSFSDSSHDGIYLGTDGIVLGKQNFVVTTEGKMTAKSATFEGSISGSSISGGTVSGTTITGGSININDGVFKVTSTGAMTATSATIEGKITATSGKIAGWTIGASTIYNYVYAEGSTTEYTKGVGMGTGAYAFYTGRTNTMSSIADCPFYVKNDGTFKATNATITGSITASSFTLTGDAAIPPGKVTGLTDAKVTYTYVVSTSGTTVPSSGWDAKRPTSIDKGKYLWTKIYTVNLDGTSETTYNCEYYSKDGTNGKDGKDGANGKDGAYITSVVDLYNLNTSKPSKPTTSTTINTTDVQKAWTTVVPTYVEGYTYYRSVKYTYSNSSVKFADVYADYGLSVANEEAKSAANVVEPFTKDGLTWGQTWGGTTYGVCLTGSSYDRPMLIGSNKGITIAKSATSSDGAAVVINQAGIKMHASSFTVTTTKSTAGSATNAINMDTNGIQIFSGAGIEVKANAKIDIKTDGKFIINSTNFKITDAGAVTVTGTINASAGSIAGWTIKSGFIGNGASVTATSVGIGDSSYTLWAGKGTSESNIANAKVYIKNDGAAKFGNFSVDTSGNATCSNLTCSNLTMTGGSITGDDTIEISAKSIRIKSGDSYITLAGTNTTANTAKTTANNAKTTADAASETASAASTTANAANTKATNIENGTTAVKKLVSTGITISGNSITATATADINFASANSISLKSGSLNFSTISGSTGITLSNGSMTLASGNITLTGGKIIVGSATVGATIDGNKIDVNGSDGYVHLRTSDTNYAYIDPGIIDLKATKNGTTSQLIVNNTGVAIAGGTLGLTGSSLNIISGKIYINGREFDNTNLFARDDIRIVTSSKSESTIISEMTNKHDWVLIKPYYDATIRYSRDGYYSTTSSGYNTNVVNMPQDGGSAAKSFGQGSSWYNYVLTGTIEPISGEAILKGNALTVSLSNSNTLSNRVQFSGTVDVENPVNNFSVSSGNIGTNLCSEGTLIYMRLDSAHSYQRVSNLRLTCTCDATTAKVPCTVYYYP